MAESFAFAVAERVLEKLASNTYKEIRLAWDYEGEVKKLEEILSTIKAVLLDAEEKQKQATNNELRVWLARLKGALYDAENVLDEYEYEITRRRVLQLYGTAIKKVGRFFSSSNSLVFRFKMGNKIKQIRERLEEIASHKAKFHLSELNENRHVLHRTRDMTHSYVEASNIIGRDVDKEKILDLLMNPSEDRKIYVISIIGLGGMGKTALAKLVFNDIRVDSQFKHKMWVCVSENFHIKKLVEEIIKSAASSTENLINLEMEQLQRKLRETIGGKKYFLVLDDVWNEQPIKWNELKELLCMGANGSKILVTTRSKKVASIVGTIPAAYELSGLSDDESKALFTKFAFKEGQEKDYPNLLKIGDEILKKCKGVPLAVKTLASLLLSQTDEDYWKYIRENELWNLEQKEDEILPALRLSYEQLPSHLKTCFAYFSLFPKDYNFVGVELVQVWMAHGLVHSRNKNEELEDVGKRYIEELASRSFFQDFQDSFGFEFLRFKMHDLIHDLALSLTKNECAIITCSTKQISESVRLLSFAKPTSLPEDLPMMLQQLDGVQTISFGNTKDLGLNNQSILNLCLSKFHYQRMLDLSWYSNVDLPKQIGTLKHLRYLRVVSNSKIKRLPKSICKLHHLQALDLWRCDEIEELPKDIRCLVNLRHLKITTKQECLPKNGIGSLKSLRKLSIVFCPNLKYLFEDMQGLRNLQLLLIVKCNQLISLPQSVKYLVTLKTLFISNCQNLDLTIEEEKINEELSAFCVLELILIRLPKLVNLPLWLFQGYTLKSLYLRNCDNLRELPACLRNIESLRQLEIRNCGELGERCKREEGQDWSKIDHIPKVIIHEATTSDGHDNH
ncbi:putative disease resistance protein RGA1 [Jatropha curcas]|uniref:putative disease resistance protein RGA1 n=1 Tax=Jatropha curcas TaxID=180498 RepID=UPI0018945A98|nr:putative disease resistance protein RGA1 [Jatropha curcas]